MTTPGRAGRDRPVRALATSGVLDRFGTELIGATLEAIDKAEDREQFRDAMERIGLECARGLAVHSPAGVREGPARGRAFISVRDRDKPQAVELGRRLTGLGFSLVATRGTARVLRAGGLAPETINKLLEGPPHIVDALKDNLIAFVVNTTESAKSVADSSGMRRTALLKNVPYATTIPGARAMLDAISALREQGLEVAPLQSYGRETATG